MTNKLLKKFSILVLFIVTISYSLLFFTGCKKSKFNELISCSLLKNVKNLDPQTASNAEEITIINNIFEGLYKKTLDGNFCLGVAKNVEKQEDGKKLTFTLKDNIFWKSTNKNATKKKVTAQDFVFSFKRLISPNTNSPHAANFFFIKNAEKINKGKASLEELGVSAPKENELVLKLEYVPPMLESLLSSPAAMPCNEEFFNSTKARYGTTKENIISNGPFYLNSWTATKEANKLKIRVNELYPERKEIKIIGVNFTVRDKDENLNLFKNKETDTAIIDANLLNTLDKKTTKIEKLQNNVTGIIFNQNNEFFKNENVRLALANSVNKEKLKNKLEQTQTIANSIFSSKTPDSLKNTEKTKNYCPEYDPKKAIDFLNKARALNKSKKKNKDFNLNGYSILTLNKANPVLNQLIQTWQKDLKLFLKIEEKDETAILKDLKNNTFDSALITLEGEFNNPASIFNTFTANSLKNYANYNIKELNEILNSNKFKNDEEKNTAAEKLICQEGYFIPLYFETQYLAYNSKIENLLINPLNKTFYFAHCKCN